jgi:hypothetical protein
MDDREFYNIANLSHDFTATHDKGGLNRDDVPALMRWQVRSQLAIAQQLAVISGHLGRLVALCESIKGQS